MFNTHLSMFRLVGAALVAMTSSGAFAAGQTVHAGKTCQALHDKCIARAAKANDESTSAFADCDRALSAALATPIKVEGSIMTLYSWPQIGAHLPEKCTN